MDMYSLMYGLPREPIIKHQYKLIDNKESISEAFHSIKNSKVIAVDCEGDSLSRKGVLTLIQIRTEDEKTFLFDVLTLKDDVIPYIKSIMEDESILKITFDFRNDVDALLHQFQVNTRNLLDLQLIEFWFREGLTLNTNLKTWYSDKIQRGRSGWDSLFLPSLKQTREFYRHNWKTRPLTESDLQYAANDVFLIFEKYRKYYPKIDDTSLPFFSKLSQDYAYMHARKGSRSYTHWEENAIVPIWVFVKSTHYQRYCPNCQMQVAAEFFNKKSPLCYRCWLEGVLDKRRQNRNDDDEY